MKIALIAPSSLLYMPYLKNYTTLLDDLNVKYDIINWDRFNIEETNILTYKDKKIGHQRNFVDYLRYKYFIKEILKKEYDKLIVFGIPLAFFLKSILDKNYTNKYILDIRDYHKILNIFKIDNIINNSFFVILSSPKYKTWLPQNVKYIINHNTNFVEINKNQKLYVENANSKNISISYIGTIRDYRMNLSFIDSLKNDPKIILYYHGKGIINNNISAYLNKNKILNVQMTGEYNKEEEKQFYQNTDMINILIPRDDINSRTLLPNRLYNAVFYGKPIIALNGTYLAEIVKEYQLGIVIKSFSAVKHEILNYFKTFDMFNYNEGRNMFFRLVKSDNALFKTKLIEFINK